MSKERAVRRAEREREAAIKTAARAAEAERRERKAASTRAIKAVTTDKLPKLKRVGRDTGVLARKRRMQNFVLVDLLLVLHIVIWFVARDVGVQFGALVVTILVFPVLKTLLFPR